MPDNHFHFHLHVKNSSASICNLNFKLGGKCKLAVERLQLIMPISYFSKSQKCLRLVRVFRLIRGKDLLLN